MKVEKTGIVGVVLFTPTPHVDERGFFSRTFDVEAWQQLGVDPTAFVQDSQSRSRRGVIRGMHLRRGSGEAKLVRCSYGAVLDVVIDFRPQSPTYGRVETFELDDENLRSVYIPRGCLHGFQALAEPADVCYRIDAPHDPTEDVTVRYDDPGLGIGWPMPAEHVSPRDLQAPGLDAVLHELGYPTFPTSRPLR